MVRRWRASGARRQSLRARRKQKPLSRSAFAIPVSNKTAYGQFLSLVLLCSWLLSRLGCEFAAKKTDDPASTAASLCTDRAAAGCS